MFIQAVHQEDTQLSAGRKHCSTHREPFCHKAVGSTLMVSEMMPQHTKQRSLLCPLLQLNGWWMADLNI